MITIFNRREVYVGFSMEKFAQIRDVLSANHLNYTYKVINSSGYDSRKYGGLGQNYQYTYEYYLYVHKDDYEEACYLINHCK